MVVEIILFWYILESNKLVYFTYHYFARSKIDSIEVPIKYAHIVTYWNFLFILQHISQKNNTLFLMNVNILIDGLRHKAKQKKIQNQNQEHR